MSLFPKLPQNMFNRSNEITSPAVVYDAESLTHVVHHLRRRLGSVKKNETLRFNESESECGFKCVYVEGC